MPFLFILSLPLIVLRTKKLERFIDSAFLIYRYLLAKSITTQQSMADFIALMKSTVLAHSAVYPLFLFAVIIVGYVM